MFFSSLPYFIFLPVVFLLFTLTPDRRRWLVLLLASYVFYGFLLKPALPIVLTVVILVTFWFGRLIDRSRDLATRRRLLWAGVVANLSLLLYFKYVPFLAQNLNILFKSVGSSMTLEVPPLLVSIGLSFFIFQAISYLADIYFRTAMPEPHLGYLALYLCFFPKLLQGPIERSNDLLPQLKQPYRFDYDTMRTGMLLFAWGMFKKVVVADRLSLYANGAYGFVHGYSGLALVLATYLYALQIYFDFSGYTDMALGSARLFNIRLTRNFNSPYLATSVSDFWRRWHISFSRWILDYVFEPLQMQFRNGGKWGIAAALLVTFVLAGLWHGASWTYILFGLTHGIYLSAAFIYKPYRKKLHKTLNLKDSRLLNLMQVAVTFNLVCFAFIFFRANNVADAWYVVTHLFSATTGLRPLLFNPGATELAILMLSLGIVLAVTLLGNWTERFRDLPELPLPVRWGAYLSLVLGLLLFNSDASKAFIYFQF